MGSKQFLIATAAAVALLAWWVTSVNSEIAGLRTELVKAQAAVSERAEASEGRSSRRDVAASRAAARDAAPSSERTLQELQQAKERIVELEGALQQFSDAWNQFTADEEAQQAEEAMRESALQQTLGTVYLNMVDDGGDRSATPLRGR